MLPLLVLAMSASAASQQEVVLVDRYVRVGDLAVAPEHADEVVAQLSSHTTSMELDVVSAERLLRNRFPGLHFRLRFDTTIRLSVVRAELVQRGACFAASSDLSAKEHITSRNTEQVACIDQKPSEALAYDRELQVPLAKAFIPAGTYLGSLRPAARRTLPKGQRMTLRFSSGPIIVEREVVTLQPGLPDQKVFAVAEDGEVMAARLAPNDMEGSR